MNLYEAVAISGGKDSFSLAWIYLGLKREVGWIHINHLWINSSLQNAYRLHLFGTSTKLKICLGLIKRKNTETHSRRLRYLAFLHISCNEKFSIVNTAHNANDSIESIIHFFLRGNRSTGIYKRIIFQSNLLSKMRLIVIRPIIGWTRHDIHKFHSNYALPYIFDSTNNYISMKRNRIRKQLIPLLRLFYNASIEKSLWKLTMKKD